MRWIRFDVLPRVAAVAGLAIGCGGPRERAAVPNDTTPWIATAASATDSIAPIDRFLRSIAAHCGNAYEGRIVANVPAPDNDPFADKTLVMHVLECSATELRIPFHVGDDRSRTWVLTRTDAGLRLKHDHRHQDGAPDSVTMYGGDTSAPGTAERQEFPVDGESIALFERAGLGASTTNTWAMQVELGKRFVYELSRPSGRLFRVEFDLTRPVAAPPLPWGAPEAAGNVIAVLPEAPGSIEAISLLGMPLQRAALTEANRGTLEANLEAAFRNYRDNPDDPESTIWLGRRLAYLGRHRDAIRVYSLGLARWPDSFTLYRHRGHRYITVRNFAAAVADLEKAAVLIAGVPDAIEPDGAPNPQNVPRSTSHSNIWYHLGLAYYLQGDFTNARRCYRECLRFCTNDDMLCATSDWLYMTCRRLGMTQEANEVLAPIHAEMEIFESHSYQKRLLMYKGALQADALLDPADASALDLATQGYGAGNWYLYNGQPDRARDVFQRVVAGESWAAFGHIAAEAELARLSASR